MRRIGLLCLAGIVGGIGAGFGSGCASSQDADWAGWPREVPVYPAEAFYETIRVSGSSFNQDATKILVSADYTGVMNAYEIDTATGERTALTNSTTDAVLSATYFPNDDRLIYMADQGGNELFHVYVRDTDGTVTDLTPGANTRAIFGGFSHDGESFFVQANDANPAIMSLYRFDANTLERQLVFRPEMGESVGPMSRDQRWITLSKVIDNKTSEAYIIDLTSDAKERRLIGPAEPGVQTGAVGFSPDSSHLLLASDFDSEWRRIWKVPVEGGEPTRYIEAGWDVSTVYYSHDGNYRVHAINADASTDLTITDLRTGREIEMPDMGAGNISGVNFPRTDANGSAPKKMAFYASSDTMPPNLVVMDLETGDAKQLTDTLNPAIDPDHLVESRIVRYESFDGLEIPSVLYRPANASADNPVPALVWVHGGPGGQTRQGYSPIVQVFANHGYAVLGVNNRGSSGYGKTFFHLDDRDHGGGDLQDCIHGRYYLESLDWVDPERIGIIGGSYGGYMVCAALAFEPDSFEVGVNIFGVTNWIRTLQSIPPWWASFRDSLYTEIGDPNDPDDLERLKARSPLLHAENIVKPMLVIQGANDPRVIKAESDDIVERVRENGVYIEYVVFDDEGHGFRSRENRIIAQRAYLDFLDTFLKNAGN